MALYCRVCSTDSVHPRSIFFMNQCSMVRGPDGDISDGDNQMVI